MEEKDNKATEDAFDEEYQMPLDTINPDYEVEPEGKPQTPKANVNVRKIIIIGVVALVILVFAIEFLSSFFNKSQVSAIKPSQEIQIKPIERQQTVITQPTPPPQSVRQTANISSDLEKRLSTLEQSQSNLMSAVNSVNGQLGTIKTNVEVLTPKIEELRQALENLTLQLNKQSQEIAILNIRTKPKIKPKSIHKRLNYFKYNIQAIIPGRAWLIAKNGSTITIREGSSIPGYGIVTLIDSQQGRVMTSSGKIIRFSQQDS